jgi:hypothetical protein
MARGHDTCPGCGRPKSKGSRLCRQCRQTAIAIGVKTVLSYGTDKEGKLQRERVRKMPPSRYAALHGKADELDLLNGLPRGSQAKRAVLQAASVRFGRIISSAGDLSEEEGNWVLDWLTDQIGEARAAAFAAAASDDT